MSRYRARHRQHRSLAHRRAFLLLHVVLAAVVVITTLPGTAEAAPKLTAETIQGRITGLDASGNTVDVADVVVYAQLTTGGQYYNGETGDDGTYSITVPSAGDYDLQTVCNSGTTCGDNWADAYYNDQNSFGDADPLTVTAGTPATADFHLQRWATITGTVTDSAGNPLADITVENAPWGGGNLLSTTTAADGTYTLTNVVPGRSDVEFRDDTGAYRVQNAAWNGTTTVPYLTQPVIISPGPTVTTANVTLLPWSGLLVTALNPSSQPLPNIEFNVQTYNPRTHNWDGPQEGPLLTDSSGRFGWSSSPGKTLRFCLEDDYYAADNTPKYRYVDQCWQGQTVINNATPVKLTTAHPKFVATLTLQVAGRSMRPVDPFVVGTVAVGHQLSVDTGTWAPANVQLSYQWEYYLPAQHDYTPIAGATSSTFAPTSDLRGKTLTVTVTGTSAGYKAAMLRTGVGRVGGATPTMTPAVQIGGPATVGSRVRAVPGTITPAGADVQYEWLVGGVPHGSWQSGSTSLAVTASMRGKVIELRTQVYANGYPNQLQLVTQTVPVS